MRTEQSCLSGISWESLGPRETEDKGRDWVSLLLMTCFDRCDLMASMVVIQVGTPCFLSCVGEAIVVSRALTILGIFIGDGCQPYLDA